MLPAPATRAVIYSAAQTAPAPAHAGPPVLAALKITASCVLSPLRACHAHCLRPAALTLRPRRPRSARASRSGILHASPSLRWLDQSGARGEIIPLRFISGEASPRQRELRSEYRTGEGVAGQLVFRCFFAFVLPLLHGGPVCRPPPARFLIRGPEGGALRRFLPPAALMRGLPMVKGE
jgi:hypothetical protein